MESRNRINSDKSFTFFTADPCDYYKINYHNTIINVSEGHWHRNKFKTGRCWDRELIQPDKMWWSVLVLRLSINWLVNQINKLILDISLGFGDLLYSILILHMLNKQLIKDKEAKDNQLKLPVTCRPLGHTSIKKCDPLDDPDEKILLTSMCISAVTVQ